MYRVRLLKSGVDVNFHGIMIVLAPKNIAMENNLKNTGTRDESRISLEKDEDVNFWTAKFGIPAEGLQSAIKAAGSDLADKVQEWLGKNKK
jgi:hypothetical protein